MRSDNQVETDQKHVIFSVNKPNLQKNSQESVFFNKLKSVFSNIFAPSTKNKSTSELRKEQNHVEQIAHTLTKLEQLKESYEKKETELFSRVSSLIDPLLHAHQEKSEYKKDHATVWIEEANALIEHLEPLATSWSSSSKVIDVIEKLPVKKLVKKEAQFISNYMQQQLSMHQLDNIKVREFELNVAMPVAACLKRVQAKIDQLSIAQIGRASKLREDFYNRALQLVDDFFIKEHKVSEEELDEGSIIYEIYEE